MQHQFAMDVVKPFRSACAEYVCRPSVCLHYAALAVPPNLHVNNYLVCVCVYGEHSVTTHRCTEACSHFSVRSTTLPVA